MFPSAISRLLHFLFSTLNLQARTSRPGATYYEKGLWWTIAAQCLISSCVIARLGHRQARNHSAEECELRWVSRLGKHRSVLGYSPVSKAATFDQHQQCIAYHAALPRPQIGHLLLTSVKCNRAAFESGEPWLIFFFFSFFFSFSCHRCRNRVGSNDVGCE